MENKKTIQVSALATSALMLGAMASGNAMAGDVTPFVDLGSGAELRSELLATNNPIQFVNNREVELKCGEGSCGEKAKEDKSDKKAKAAADETKAADRKTGEGTCGEKATQEERDAAREKAMKRDAEKAKTTHEKRTEEAPEK